MYLGKDTGTTTCDIMATHYTVANLTSKLKGVWHQVVTYTLSNKNQAAWHFLSPALEMTWRTVGIIIHIVSLSTYLCIRGISVPSIHYSQSRHLYINWRHQYICLMWQLKHELKFIMRLVASKLCYKGWMLRKAGCLPQSLAAKPITVQQWHSSETNYVVSSPSISFFWGGVCLNNALF